MAVHKLHNGAEIDFLNNEELAGTLREVVRENFQERARGVSLAEFRTFQTAAASTLALPSGTEERIGPQPGYAWLVKRIAIDGLATNDVVKVYRSTAATPTAAQQGGSFIAAITASPGFIRLGKDCILRGQQSLWFIGTGLAATVPIIINGDAEELPESDLYKPLS